MSFEQRILEQSVDQNDSSSIREPDVLQALQDLSVDDLKNMSASNLEKFVSASIEPPRLNVEYLAYAHARSQREENPLFEDALVNVMPGHRDTVSYFRIARNLSDCSFFLDDTFFFI